MKKPMFKNYWWVIGGILLCIAVVSVAIINDCCLNRIINDSLNYINLLITPIGIIVGFVLGYPLLRKKLVEGYVVKQFNIMDDANRCVRKQCLDLLEKYPVRHISNSLTAEYLESLVNDIKELKDCAIDSNKNAYKYLGLFYNSLVEFQQGTKGGIPNGWMKSYYNETLSSFAHKQIQQVYDLSSSIVNIPSNDTVKKRLLNKKLDKYVRGNDIYMVEGFDLSLSHYHDSALLVLFFGNYINSLNKDNGLLFECCYKSAPTPSALARILYVGGIYLPLKIAGNTILNFATPELVLTGYKRVNSTNMSDGIKTHYLVCHYANISSFGFMSGVNEKSDIFPEFRDSYLGIEAFNINDIESFDVDGERLIIKIDERKAMECFKKVKGKLKKKMVSETN